jgi:hypothetical protein
MFLTLLLFAGCGDSEKDSHITVTLLPDNTQVLASFTDYVTLTATVRDGSGSPLANQAIQFNGPFEAYNYNAQALTDINGSAILLLSHWPVDPSWSDVLHITATSGGVTSNEVVINFSNPQGPATITLEADKTLVTAVATDKVTFTATVKDKNGILLAMQRVNLNIPPGPYIIGLSSGTNYEGQAIMSLHRRPDGLVGSQSISVTASCGGIISNAVTITFTEPV